MPVLPLDKLGRRFWLVFNSCCACFTVTCWLCYAYSASQGLAMKVLGLRAILFFGKIEMFHNPMTVWAKNLILVVYAFPMVMLLLLVVFLYYWWRGLRRSNSLLRLYVHWAYVFGFVLLFASLVQGIFLYQGLAVIFTWFRIPQVANQVIGTLAAAGLLACGFLLRTVFLRLAPSSEWQVEQHPQRFTFLVALVPIAFTFLLLGPIAYRVRSFQYLVWLACPFILLTGILAFSTPLTGKVSLVRNFPIDRFSPVVLAVGVLTGVAVLYLTGHGIRIG
jgi:hypothetical protein